MKLKGKHTFDPYPHSRFDREEWRRIPDCALMLHAPTGVMFEIGGEEPDIYAQLIFVPDGQGTPPLAAEIDLGHQAVAAFRDEFQRWTPEPARAAGEQPKGPFVQ